jgi:hypothetical protein
MITVLIFIFVVVVTAVLFGLWVVVSIGRLIWSSLNGKPRQSMTSMGSRPCMNPGCRSGNPMHARFCRRCGSDLREPVFNQRKPQMGPRFNPSNGRERQVASDRSWVFR